MIMICQIHHFSPAKLSHYMIYDSSLCDINKSDMYTVKGLSLEYSIDNKDGTWQPVWFWS